MSEKKHHHHHHKGEEKDEMKDEEKKEDFVLPKDRFVTPWDVVSKESIIDVYLKKYFVRNIIILEQLVKK